MRNAAVRMTTLELPERDELADLLRGLRAKPPQVSPMYFYDERGSQLFDAICDQPEYYPTRTELGIMRAHIGEIAALIGPRVSLIEYGSGSSLKTRLLLEALDAPVAYLPVDISGDYLMSVARELTRRYPDIEILPICADFTQPLDLPRPRREAARNILYFPGSTIGNFSQDQAAELLRQMRTEAGDDGGLLIGVDMIKSREILEPAYNDAAGVTAQFNLNLLRHLNREFGSNFDRNAFEHVAVYDAQAQRIEMRLVALRAQTIRVAGETLKLARGEYIVTEHSHKYSQQGFAAMAAAADFEVTRVWTDPQQLFSVQYLEAV